MPGGLDLDTLIRRSREARSVKDIDGSMALLEQARCQAQEQQPDREGQITWLLAKAAWDSERIDVLARCVSLLVAMPDPFAGSKTAREMSEPVARRLYDVLGYADVAADRLLDAAAAAWREDGDRVRAEWIVIQAAWAQACRGQVEELFAEAERLDRLGPHDLDGSPSRHARAEGPRDSVPWIQLDIWRAALRAAVWARHPRRAAEALDGLEDAVEACGLTRESDAFLLENVCTAQLLLHQPSPHDMAAWGHACASLEGERAVTHRALHAAWSQGDDVQLFLEAAEYASHSDTGHEWTAWALQGAALCGYYGARERLEDLARTRGLTVFQQGLAAGV